MGAVIRILFIIVLVYYVIRFIDRHVVPFLFGRPGHKTGKVKDSASKEFRKKTRQGDITITDFGERKKDVNPGEDDYVDYEEV